MPFEDVESQIEKIERRWHLANTVLPESVARRLIDIEWAESKRERHLEVTDKFDGQLETLAGLCDDLESDISTLAEDPPDDPEPLLDKIDVRLDQAQTCIDAIEELNQDLIRADPLERFDSLSQKVSKQEKWTRAYEDVGRHADAAARELRRANDQLASFEGYERYMTRSDREQIRDALDSADSAIALGLEAARSSPLVDDFLDRLTELQQKLKKRRRLLERYNQEFMEREVERYPELFTDIDDEGHDLSQEQRGAVLHDDDYNLVVAGAGSGKTVTLAHRVAYLTGRRDRVPPERILAISYTNNAAEVMGSRLREKFGITGVETTTFHSLSNGILKDELETEPEVFKDSDRREFIERFINRETDRSGSEFKKYHFQFLKHFYDDVDISAEFSEKESTVTDVLDDTHLTLKQEQVRTRSEKTIADFLFLHQVEYEYRSLQDWVEKPSGRGTYRADFYLPEYDIVISHRPLYADATIADWGTADDLTDLETTVQWELGRFDDDPTHQLVETYEFEAENDRLERALESRLIDSGVILDEMSYEEFVESAFDYANHRSKIIGLYSSFINNARQLHLSPGEVEERVADAPPKEYAFGQCVSRLYRAFCDHLRENDYIDFPGMLYRAIDVMEEDSLKYQNRYDQVLVDEFQDISQSEVELLKQFVKPDNDTTLFSVGDDWQSIFSFAGSEVEFFINFEKYFDEPQRTELTANYRCPPTVVNAGNDLIANNEKQIDKTAEPVTDEDYPIWTHDLSAPPDVGYYRSNLCSYTVALIEKYLQSGAAPNEIMILSRTNSFYDDIETACHKKGIKTTRSPENEDEPEEFVRLFSVHNSKGDEADHVIIIHAVEDLIGFPSKVENDDLLEPVNLTTEDEIHEERRLFYVALTRSSGTLDIVTSDGHRSRFLNEISHYLTPVQNLATLDNEGERIDLGSVRVKESFGSGNSQTQAGILDDGVGSSRFVIWEDSPHDPLETDTAYKVSGARVNYNDFNDSYEIHFDDQTSVQLLDA